MQDFMYRTKNQTKFKSVHTSSASSSGNVDLDNKQHRHSESVDAYLLYLANFEIVHRDIIILSGWIAFSIGDSHQVRRTPPRQPFSIAVMMRERQVFVMKLRAIELRQ
jgi:hypothetical protein